jgi:branched-chain amino acid transport system substrate-binding protein
MGTCTRVVSRMFCVAVVVVMACLCAASPLPAEEPSTNDSVKVGWIGPMTGELAKWGSYEAALLALEDIKDIGGRKLEIIFEDGKSQGKDAASAAQKLINVDHVKYILGGQCTRESLAIAPIAEKAGVVMIAAITSNPFLTTAGDNIFRITAVSTTGAEKMFKFAAQEKKLKSFAVLYEEADYPRPQADRFKSLVLEKGLTLTAYEGFMPGETDVRSILTRIKSAKPDAMFIATTSPDFAALLLRQIRELHLEILLLGNENTGHAVNSAGADKGIFDGIIFAASKYDPERPKAKKFLDKYRSRYHVDALPYGAYTAEPYDTVLLLADVITKCGDDVASVRKCLYGIKNYEGASGQFSIDSNGDAIRDYEILEVNGGQVSPIASVPE